MVDIGADDRARGAVWGQFVGDALCLGSHWHYNLVERDRLYPQGVQGFDAPVEGHYHAGRKSGEPTHYGDAALVLLRSLVERGQLDHIDYGSRFVAEFDRADYKGYRDKPTLLTIQAYKDWVAAKAAADFDHQQGADDQQTVTMSRLPPVVVRHRDDPGLDRVVERAVRVCQNNDRTVFFHQIFARVLARVLNGEPLREAIETTIGAAPGEHADEARKFLGDAKATQKLSAIDAAGAFGRSCYLTNTFPCLLHAALKHGDDPATALIETARAGGDNASRAAALGAWVGAANGVQAIPAEWRDRLARRKEIGELTEDLIADMRTG